MYLPYSQISASVVVLGLGLYYFYRRRRSLPGPRGYPVIGNLFDMPKTKEWLHWAQFKDRYGPISAVRVLGQTIILLNTIDVCNDLLDRRSAIYSGRPVLHFAGGMVGWDRQLIFTQDGERHKVMRKMVARFIGTKHAVSAYKDVQEAEARWFLLAMASHPMEVLTNIRTATSAMFLKMAHGYTLEREEKDPLVNLIETAAQEFYIAAAPGSWLVDFIPWLQYLPDWLPGTRFKAVAARFRETNMRQVNVPITFVKEQMAKGSATPCFSSRVLESKLTPQEAEAFPYVATALYGGGQDTVSATIGTFFLAMILFPEVQRKAQEEIDNVVGQYRLPSMEDLENLPYLNAVLKEVMRWHTVACINGPHFTLDDDWYEGCYIPKGSIVLANLWQIANDTKYYADPLSFKPERFLGENPEMDPNTFVWGFGRRRCPGIELAKACCLHTMATTLSVLDIVKAKDENGIELTPTGEFISGTICHPEPFPCDTRPRSADAEILLRAIKRDYIAQPSDSSKLKL